MDLQQKSSSIQMESRFVDNKTRRRVFYKKGKSTQEISGQTNTSWKQVLYN